MNIGTFPTRRARLAPTDLAAVDGDRRVTYAELDARCERVARALQRLGTGTGDRIGVLLPNSIEWLEYFFAAARIGAIVVPLNWRLASDELAAICTDAGVGTLVYAPETPVADELLSKHAFTHQIATGRGGAAQARVHEDVLTDPATRDHFEPRGGGEDPLLIIYTSGTTGRPKGAVHSHRHWYWAVATITATQDLRAGDRGLVVAPMYHVGGLVMSTVHVAVGAASVCMPSFDADAMLRIVRDEDISHFLCVPTMLNMIRQHERFASADFSSVRWCYSVGSPTPPSLIETFARRGLRVQAAYGLTETGGPATVVPAPSVLAKLGSVGVPFFHTDVRVVDEDGAPVPRETTGEIEIRGPHVIDTYWRNPDATAAAIRNGWLWTADMGTMDPDGYLYLVDRKHDLILSGGENVYPAEVERVLFDHPAIADVVVFGVGHDTWGEQVCAAVTVRADASLTEVDLLAYCRTRLAGYKVPRRVVFLEALPRTATGKPLRRELRARLGDRP